MGDPRSEEQKQNDNQPKPVSTVIPDTDLTLSIAIMAEIDAMRLIAARLDTLQPEAQARVLHYLNDRFKVKL